MRRSRRRERGGDEEKEGYAEEKGSRGRGGEKGD